MSQSRRQFLKTTGTLLAAQTALSLCPQSFAGEESKKRPNILFFFPDQHRYDWIGATPTIPVHTPNLDALGLRGVRFSRAYCPSPLCAPSRACIAAGKEYDHCRVPSNREDYPLDQTTFYTLLRDSGYHVAGCGKFDLHKGSPTWGLDGKHRLEEWGFSDGIDNAGKWDAINSGAKEPKDPYMHYLRQQELLSVHVEDFNTRRGKDNYCNTAPTLLAEEAYCDNWVGKNGLKLIRQSPKGKPWFLQVNFTGPHSPMDITQRMDAICRDRDFLPPNRNSEYDEKIHNAIRQNYSAMIENIDRWLGLYIEELIQRGELENTLIVFSSDHGEMLGDHNLWGKSKPHEASVGVPLVLAGPQIKRGLVSNALVSAMDLTATFLEYAEIPIPQTMDSRSLCPILHGKTEKHRDVLLSGLGNWRVAFDGEHKLVTGYGKNGEDMLFDMTKDRLENENSAAKASEKVKTLKETMLKPF
ncbi:MAG: choline-sulfatase [Candidatus Omnitrophota bacterium]|jgi:arylsulfatase A-like enzyme|nr:MAG: choline-sulfatase [Candidatus Omnitrophota bacterium]